MIRKNVVTNQAMDKFPYRRLLLLTLPWILLWILPWTIWLDSLPWIKLGISLIVLAVPGMSISFLLVGKRLNLPTHFTSGLAISVLLVGSLGLLGRIFHLPFEFIRPAFALIGLVGLFVLIYLSPARYELYKPKRFSLTTLALLLGMVILGIVINLQSRFGGDDISYLAYLTNWQHAQPLNFGPIIFESGDVDTIRFWFAMLPMSWAFLAEISNLHGLLLLGIYLEPYLLVIAILAIYNLYEDFLKKETLAIAAALLQFTFLVLLQEQRQPGSILFFRISEDKVFAAFILAPALFLAIRHFLSSFTFRTGALAFLCGLSLTLTHPVILAYSLFIVGLYTSIICILERNYKKFGVCMLLLIIIVLPAVALRFVDGPLTTRYVNNLERAIHVYGEDSGGRFSYIEGTPFYGFDLGRLKIKITEPDQENLLQAFFSWSYLWVLVIGFIWSLLNLRKKSTAPFVFATSALVLLCGIPYTGWLIGYFLVAGQLWRSPWLVPIGFIGIVLAVDAAKYLSQKVSICAQANPNSERAILGLFSAICIILMSYSSIPRYAKIKQAVANRNTYQDNLERLSLLGNYLENNLEQSSIFVAPPHIMKLLPGLSSKADVVFFRTNVYTRQPVDLDKLKLIFSPDASVPMKRRMNIIRRYQVQHVILTDHSVKDFYAHYTDLFKIQETNGFWILELRDSSSSFLQQKFALTQ
jgi:hypothetical protein